MRLSREHYDEIVAHARAEAPDECCGMIAAHDGASVEVHRARNADASPYRYTIEPSDQLRIHSAIDDADLDLGAIYHSHTRSAPYPSQTDINLALSPGGGEELWPGTLYVIVGVADDQEDVRAFRILAGGQVEEAALEVG